MIFITVLILQLHIIKNSYGNLVMYDLIWTVYHLDNLVGFAIWMIETKVGRAYFNKEMCSLCNSGQEPSVAVAATSVIISTGRCHPQSSSTKVTLLFPEGPCARVD